MSDWGKLLTKLNAEIEKVANPKVSSSFRPFGSNREQLKQLVLTFLSQLCQEFGWRRNGPSVLAGQTIGKLIVTSCLTENIVLIELPVRGQMEVSLLLMDIRIPME